MDRIKETRTRRSARSGAGDSWTAGKALNLGNFIGFKVSERELTMFTCDFARGHREATRSELMRLTCSYSAKGYSSSL